MIYACIALIGFGNSNVFSVIFSQALLYLPVKKNEGFRLDDYGTFRRNSVSVGYGSCLRCNGAEWGGSRNDGGRNVSFVLYVPY